MSEQEYLVGKCRKCGEELRVPVRLKEFSCMFCGAKLTPEDLVEEMPPVTPMGDPAALKERVARDLIRCITDYPDINRMITRKDYVPMFERYERECSSLFEDLDLLCRLEPQQQDAHIGNAVTAFLDQLEQRRAAGKKGARSGKVTMAMENDKMTIAVFLVPMVRHLKLPVSEPFCQALQEAWVARYPQSPFYLGSYDEIASGFRRKIFGLCFITTAVCEAEGKPDDCAELTAFRAFRDGYLAACPDGAALTEEYYNIAPGIVTCINLCADRQERYEAIRKTYLQPCYEDLQAGRNEACKARYIQMVRDLEQQYLS